MTHTSPLMAPLRLARIWAGYFTCKSLSKFHPQCTKNFIWWEQGTWAAANQPLSGYTIKIERFLHELANWATHRPASEIHASESWLLSTVSALTVYCSYRLLATLIKINECSLLQMRWHISAHRHFRWRRTTSTHKGLYWNAYINTYFASDLPQPLYNVTKTGPCSYSQLRDDVMGR